MKFNFDSNEPVPGAKETRITPTEKALIVIGVGAIAAVVLFKWLAAFSSQLADYLFPSLF
jgi:hypothetical protein